MTDSGREVSSCLAPMKDGNLMSPCHKSANEVRPDEPSPADDQYSHPSSPWLSALDNCNFILLTDCEPTTWRNGGTKIG